ncbi:hypothetical protein [Streptomyces agglomeratus]|uniref:hypothetical protein n=1 Tax=Streptomyces agglomeratus TaxID=285458 RepID=UPI001428A624|nr:hypothetical protein [Streptomyces agglomeratus]
MGITVTAAVPLAAGYLLGSPGGDSELGAGAVDELRDGWLARPRLRGIGRVLIA